MLTPLGILLGFFSSIALLAYFISRPEDSPPTSKEVKMPSFHPVSRTPSNIRVHQPEVFEVSWVNETVYPKYPTLFRPSVIDSIDLSRYTKEDLARLQIAIDFQMENGEGSKTPPIELERTHKAGKRFH